MPPPPPPAPPPPVEYREDEDDDEEEDDEEAAPTSGIPDFVRLLIKEAVDKVVPLIFEKLTSGGGLGGLPLGALLDWRKAVPNPAAAPSAPAAPAAPSEPAAPAAPSTPAASSGPMPSAPASWPVGAAESHATTSPPRSPAPPGGAPSRESPPGAAPAAASTPPTTSSPRTQEDAAAAINAHVLQVWQGLTLPERARAGQLIARLTAEERTAWLAELARLTVPEAITRARAIIHAQPPPPPTPQLPTTTPHRDPS